MQFLCQSLIMGIVQIGKAVYSLGVSLRCEIGGDFGPVYLGVEKFLLYSQSRTGV